MENACRFYLQVVLTGRKLFVLSSGHLFFSAPDGTPQFIVDSSHLNQQQFANVETTTSEKPNMHQVHYSYSQAFSQGPKRGRPILV